MVIMERLQKVIAARGLASRRQAELMITQGRVKVNGILVTELGTKVDPLTAELQVDGKLLSAGKEPLYLLLYKPIGYVTTMSDPQQRPIVSDLLTGVDARLYPVGRLDYYSSGLLLCTNDGELAHRMMHPRYKLTKHYRVTVTGHISDADLKRLREGMELDDGFSKPEQVAIKKFTAKTTELEIVLREGRNRQVRRMLAVVNYPVQKLVRTQIGFLRLGSLPKGKYRFLQPHEVTRLRRLVGLS
ncbi:MAG: pseudouridine synthase [Pseudomonadota bacterium]|nr:pseudouridine synthase [Pseudomonadota bacterium]